jgi:hypothetical protein
MAYQNSFPSTLLYVCLFPQKEALIRVTLYQIVMLNSPLNVITLIGNFVTEGDQIVKVKMSLKRFQRY